MYYYARNTHDQLKYCIILVLANFEYRYMQIERDEHYQPILATIPPPPLQHEMFFKSDENIVNSLSVYGLLLLTGA